ncbi:hypothetical protein EGT74_20205 [Chitinophaga lutea]|uniref:YCII-related domain-containing protein n=1 Tax=Chitinophaga lutea TaxID=2488634 RepID=A0A3N4QC38_9BACT|nr:hypothetical protein [Chitinophaga lutea]RPE09324.1 hypothetical protein EGT74_20205 [Chitinophaga lutea]
MAKLLPVFLLAVFLTVVVAAFLPRSIKFKPAVAEQSDTTQQTEVKKYWTVFLTKGPAPEQDAVTAALIQEKHMSHIRRLADAGKLMVAGSFGDSGRMRSMFILDCKDSLEAVRLMESDTAVITQYLRFEVKPWWTVKNCVFK